MAIYHFSAKIISRSRGSSAVRAAAYRSASRLRDERARRFHDFSHKTGVIHSEILLPENAPPRWMDRARLWNDVEAREIRNNAQLAREIEISIPREFDQPQAIRLARDYAAREFVARGMAADWNLHWDVGADGLARPHVHVMLTMRDIAIDKDGVSGFGNKVPDWNRKALYLHWRRAWAEHVNERLARLGIDARVDHRSLQAQGIDLVPQGHVAIAAYRIAARGRPSHRLEAQKAITHANGGRIIARPAIVPHALALAQTTFTDDDIARFVGRHAAGKSAFERAREAVKLSPALVAIGKDSAGAERFTARSVLAAKQNLHRAVAILDMRRDHAVPDHAWHHLLSDLARGGRALADEERAALRYATHSRSLGVLTGDDAARVHAVLSAARGLWNAAGYHVQGAALSVRLANGLQKGSGIEAHSLGELDQIWSRQGSGLTRRHILVVAEAGLVSLPQLEAVAEAAASRGAKLLLVDTGRRLGERETAMALQAIAERHGSARIMNVPQNERLKRMSLDPLLLEPSLPEFTARHEKHPDRRRQTPSSDDRALARAVMRHAAIIAAIAQQQVFLEPQRRERVAELQASRELLDAFDPRMSAYLEAALRSDRQVMRDALAGRPAPVMRALRRERLMEDEPLVRAQSFQDRWDGLDRQRRVALGEDKVDKARDLAGRMDDLRLQFMQDPQVRAVLRGRQVERGLGGVRRPAVRGPLLSPLRSTGGGPGISL